MRNLNEENLYVSNVVQSDATHSLLILKLIVSVITLHSLLQCNRYDDIYEKKKSWPRTSDVYKKIH